MNTEDVNYQRLIKDDGSLEFRPPRAGRLRRLTVLRVDGDKPGIVDDALFSLAVTRNDVIIGLVENAHVQGFPLRLTVVWDVGDVLAVQFNPTVVGKGAQAILCLTLWECLTTMSCASRHKMTELF